MTPEPVPSTVVDSGQIRRPKRSILRSVVWQSLVISAVTIAFLSVISFVLARSLTTEQRLFEQLTLIASERKTAFEDAMNEARHTTALLSKKVDGAGATEVTEEKMQHALASMSGAALLEPIGITAFDETHTIVARTGELSPAFFYAQPNTFLVPGIDAKLGFHSLTAYTPLKDEAGKMWGTLAVEYSTAPLLNKLFDDLTSTLGKTNEITLSREQGGEIFIVQHSPSAQTLMSYPLGVVDDQFIQGTPVALAVGGKEGVTITRDDSGRKVLVAYRYLETLGWGLTVQVESSEALAGVTALALALVAISILLLMLAGLVGFFFARRLTEPLLHLVGKIRVLRPGHWTFRLSIRTGDEVELLDEVIADLTSRLQATYETLEGQVADKSQALSKQTTLDRAILESIEYGVLTTDANGKITDANSAASKLLGFNKEEFLQKEATTVLRLHAQKGMMAAENHPVTICLRDRSVFRAPPTIHITILRKDQTLLPVMLMVTPLIEDGRLLGTIIIFLDVTEERQTDYMKSEFISLASHQLRTPLSSMRWYLELLTGDPSVQFSYEQKEYLAEVQKASAQMASLLDTLLRVARLDEGGMMIERKDIDLIDVLFRLFDEIRQGNRDPRLSFRSDLPKGPLMMSTDAVLLPIVVQNLVTNAMKYSPQGGEIVLSVKEEADCIKIQVVDHGVGIPHEEQERVFEKFFRANNIRHMLTSGTGLGLYLSKRIMDSLGGHLSFDSVAGQGTTFTATLPKT